MSYLPYLCLFVYSGIQHILCCVLVLIAFFLCTLCCQFLWIVHFGLPFRYSLAFIVRSGPWNIRVKMCPMTLSSNQQGYHYYAYE